MKKQKLILFNCIYVLALAAVLFPLLLIAQYNYPSADDWSFGANTYRAVKMKGGCTALIRAVADTVKSNYLNWEGRFSIPLLGSLQPGIWGEEKYCVVPWIMTGGLIGSETFLFGTVLGAKRKNWLLVGPIIFPALILQILYTPSTVESFYWYNGSVCYTFLHALSFLLFALVFKLGLCDIRGWKYAALAAAAVVLAVFVGGGNFASSLSCLLALGMLAVIFFRRNRKGFYRIWYIPLVLGSGLAVAILAPGNQGRLNGNFGGGTTGNAAWAVWASMTRTFTNVISWTNLKVFLMILLILPFVWMAVRHIRFDFRWPAAFTLLSFGVYASQMTATVYVDGTAGGGRMAAILFYSYYVWLVGNVCYWTGWLQRVRAKWPAAAEKAAGTAWKAACRYPLLYCGAVGILLVGIVYGFDRKDISSYRAYRDWRQGWAWQYAAEWDARLEALHDDSVRQVEFEALTVYPETILYTDLQDDAGYTWVNDACASYYGKEYIHIPTPETED